MKVDIRRHAARRAHRPHCRTTSRPSSHSTRRAELAKHYPFNVVSSKPHAFLCSQYGNAQDKQRVQGEQRVFLLPDDAGERGIATGELVQVINDRGMFQGPAQLDDALMPGLVMASVALVQFQPDHNSITLGQHCTLGNAGVYSDTSSR